VCGRFALYADTALIRERFQLRDLPAGFAPHYNLAPSLPLLTIRPNKEGGRVARMRRWGLVPHWAADAKIGNKLSNARAETAFQRPSFRDAFHIGRCIIPASGYYEWQTREEDGKPVKQPYYLYAQNGEPLAMAGLVSLWIAPDGSKLPTCCVLTTTPNHMAAEIHERMPVLLTSREAEAIWLNDDSPLSDVRDLCLPCDNSYLTAHAVSRRVNAARENDAGLVERYMDPL
jgi:putative SOS response-associated peptidase YedK